MKAKSLIVLIVIVAVVAVCTGIAAAFILGRSDGELVLEPDGEPVSEAVAFGNMIPGESKSTEYSVKNSGTSVFSVTFTSDEESILADYVVVGFTVNGEPVGEKQLSDCFQTGFSCDVSGDFTFALTYTLGLDAGTDVMGAAVGISVVYSLS